LQVSLVEEVFNIRARSLRWHRNISQLIVVLTAVGEFQRLIAPNLELERRFNMDKLELLNQIQLNGIKGVDGVIDMIIDTIDDGDKEGAKDWLRQLKDEIYEVSL